MNDFFITTYIISSESKAQIEYNLDLFPELSLSDLAFPEGLTEVQKLSHILEEAIAERDDAILIISNTDFLKNYHRDTFLSSIFQLVDKKLHSLILDGYFTEVPTCINDEFFLIEKTDELKSFLLLGNTFEFIKRVIQDSTALSKGIGEIKDILNLYHIKKAFSSRLGIKKDKLIKERLIESKHHKDRNRINLIVPFRNVEKYIEECLESILSQNHLNFRVFFIDDCSSDASTDKIPNHPKFVIVRNSERKYALQNIHEVLISQLFFPDDIIAILDGDDALMDNYSLDVVDRYYRGNNLMTYGSFNISRSYSLPQEYCYTVEEFRNLRVAAWKASHLKTFKYKAYSELLSQDPELTAFKDSFGQFYKMTYDIALMLPLMEICGYDYVAFNPLPIYFYRLHENNDHMVNRALQEKIDFEIRAKKQFRQTNLISSHLFDKN
ncbi:glycosyltransferase family 2 protein [Pedobacter sp. 22163]|uniref:glycosyltransferase family 2 protein n=1 Tax=Pedobacter sp. 22163 TaxID=3453883 RepID=UPI003F85FD06